MSAKIEQLKWALVDSIFDLTIPAVLFRENQKRADFDPSIPYHLGLCRMCNSHTIIALSKLDEILKFYGKEIQSFPEPLKTKANKLKKEIEDRGAYAFRSQYVAHAFRGEKGKTKEPISLKEGQAQIEKVVGNNLNEFYTWVFPEQSLGENKDSVTSTVNELKEHCISLLGGSGSRL